MLQSRARASIAQAKDKVEACREQATREKNLRRRTAKISTDEESRVALASIQTLQHTTLVRRREEASNLRNALEEVASWMEKCCDSKQPHVSLEVQIETLEQGISMVDARKDHLRGTLLAKALQFLCHERAQLAALKRQRERVQREQIRRRRHLADVKHEGRTEILDDNTGGRESDSASVFHELSQAHCVFSVKADKRPATAQLRSTSRTPFKVPKPEKLTLAELKRKLETDEHDGSSQIRCVAGQLIWRDSGKAVGAAAEELLLRCPTFMAANLSLAAEM